MVSAWPRAKASLVLRCIQGGALSGSIRGDEGSSAPISSSRPVIPCSAKCGPSRNMQGVSSTVAATRFRSFCRPPRRRPPAPPGGFAHAWPFQRAHDAALRPSRGPGHRGSGRARRAGRRRRDGLVKPVRIAAHSGGFAAAPRPGPPPPDERGPARDRLPRSRREGRCPGRLRAVPTSEWPTAASPRARAGYRRSRPRAGWRPD